MIREGGRKRMMEKRREGGMKDGGRGRCTEL